MSDRRLTSPTSDINMINREGIKLEFIHCLQTVFKGGDNKYLFEKDEFTREEL